MISDEELNALIIAIYKRHNIDFTSYERKSLKRGFARLLSKYDMSSTLELWSKVIGNKELLSECVDELTVNLTEMFRNHDLWQQLRDEILPMYSSKKSLDIWHAGCSSGEEVYSMAILLNRLSMLRRSKLLGTDLSLSILEKAREGKYSNSYQMKKYRESMAEYFPEELPENSFDIQEKHSVIKEHLKSSVTFQQHNLVHDKMDHKFDLILCRNTMIYFNDSLELKVLKLFYDSLKDDGFFIIGYYDRLPPESIEYFTPYDTKTRVYKKNVAS